jgi:GT2 family glycosyltransferase/glycosyltransferase involved in cell wall biosynthesis
MTARARLTAALSEYYAQKRLGWQLLDAGVRLRDRVRQRASPKPPVRSLRMEIQVAEQLADQITLGFPEVPSPIVSVVIPVFNNWALTRACLGSLCKFAPTAITEVIVVDDHSTDSTATLLSRIPGLRVLTNPENQGFTLSANRGAAIAKGEYVLFLNNDTLILPGCIQGMLETMRDMTVGATGAKLVYPSGRLQEAGSMIWSDGTGWNMGREGDPTAPEYQFARDVDYCSAAALMVRTELLCAIGMFDERFAPAYYEDTDLCFEIRARGYRVVYNPDAVVVHAEGMTHGTDARPGIPGAHNKATQYRNREQFVRKRSTMLRGHVAPPGDPIAQELWGSRIDNLPRILVCDWVIPSADRDSGSHRMDAMLRLLRPLTSRLTLLPKFAVPNHDYARSLRNAGVEVLLPAPTSISELLSHRHNLYDVIILSRPDVARDWMAPVRQQAPDAIVVFDTVDIQSVRVRREQEVRGESAQLDPVLAERVDRQLIAASDFTATVTELEAELVRDLVPSARAVVLPNVHQARTTSLPAFASRRGIVFIGTFLYGPNVDGVEWFVDQILPLIRHRLDISFVAVGADPPRRLLEKAGSGVQFTGWVPNADPVFDGARVFVAPLRYGAGMKGKVGQAMALGIPTVTTTIGAEGMDLEDGTHALIRDDPRAFAEAVIDIHENEALWTTISIAAMAAVVERWSPAAMSQRLQGLLTLCTDQRAQRLSSVL